MKLLAIDTSTLVLSVAVLDQYRVLGELTTNLHKNHSVRLMPAVARLLGDLELDASDLDGVAVAAGPGSYTGVRIGFTTAKTIAWSRGIPMVSVSSLAALAMNGLRFPGGVVPLFDARRNRVYTGLFRGETNEMISAKEEKVIHLDQWLSDLRNEGPLLFLGEDTGHFQERITDVLGDQAFFGQGRENIVSAAHLGTLALSCLKRGEVDHMGAVPNYLQLTKAEADWLSKNGGKKNEVSGD
ncbi:tRNA (adenosine(37)-N6)-threonylcarbamoyltransferase complex dimerization subunit type 1 TsaB [Melghirimyces algeriensis]|uniref:tRNA threonylcarbamoyladenosine biosynthesis protein TsaB n=1 Tax=Melghirimyces algeriensis TaxID=910412 RepID=A0A521FE81_9BACL|nr:tRNA (adenosine(37)-N6)-threonylcarbamoyltransferase complex dimerization subunit type 1 TsaB [Melghirimyces algeriensis]SMO94445.1 tRNA threonylcarbamoyladenosine biosynthesis protein TsaB [Melghirimyces algeriensis]